MTPTLYWDDQPVVFIPGETLAYTLLRANQPQQGFGCAQNGQVYGLFCGIGACQSCLVEVETRGKVEACLTLAEQGMRVTSIGRSARQAQPSEINGNV